MKLNADLKKRASLNSQQLNWENSPSSGVLRRRLEQDDDKTPIERVTTIVNFSPNSSFPGHTHPGGEEFYVLDGVFSDQHGDYTEGYYIRNPKGSGHTPFSKQGCTILVKLWQMDPSDQQQVVINTYDPALWDVDANGIKTLNLFKADYEAVCLYEWPAGKQFNSLEFLGGVEYFVLDGNFSDDDDTYTKDCWLRLPAGTIQNITVNTKNRVLRKTGHLLNPVIYI